jgi:hypothetical protein
MAPILKVKCVKAFEKRSNVGEYNEEVVIFSQRVSCTSQ